MRRASLAMGSCVLAVLAGSAAQGALPTPAVEFTFTNGDFVNTGSLGGSGTIACSTPAYTWAPAASLSAAGVNPYPGNATLQSLVVPGAQRGDGIVQTLTTGDGGMFNLGHAGSASAMTLSFWVNPTALNGFLAGRANDGQKGWMLMFGGHTGGLRVAVSDQGNFDTQDTTPANQFAVNTWQFFTLSWAVGGAEKIYRNGVDLALQNYGDSLGAATDLPSQPLTFGTAGTYLGFDGSLSAIRVWDTALTPTQVGDLYASETTPTPEPTSLALLGVGSFFAMRRRRA